MRRWRHGSLTVRDLHGLDLGGAHLAYLSACSTATGSVRLADEVIHIASAFQLAGYTHAIATLWPVSDNGARRFATRIYERLVAGNEPAVAVHEAVRSVRDQIPDRPDAWASHVHYGP